MTYCYASCLTASRAQCNCTALCDDICSQVLVTHAKFRENPTKVAIAGLFPIVGGENNNSSRIPAFGIGGPVGIAPVRLLRGILDSTYNAR